VRANGVAYRHFHTGYKHGDVLTTDSDISLPRRFSGYISYAGKSALVTPTISKFVSLMGKSQTARSAMALTMEALRLFRCV